MRHLLQCVVIASASMVLGTTGCTLKGTVKQITDTTSNVTGTTSGAAWWSEDGQIKPDFKATAFVTLNQANLQQDLAAGRGEYLASMSRLLGVPKDREPAFFSAAQASYAETIGKDATTLHALLRDTSKPFVR
jgi:hypothetical protein